MREPIRPEFSQRPPVRYIRRLQRPKVRGPRISPLDCQHHLGQANPPEDFPKPESGDTTVEIEERVDGQLCVTEDAATGLDEAGISVRRWSSSSHAWFTGSPSKAMLAATLAGICAQACSRRFSGGSACHACMFASQSIGNTLRHTSVSIKESILHDDALAKAESRSDV